MAPVSESSGDMTSETSRYSMHRSLASEPHMVDHAKGSYLYLSSGKKILDGCGGAAVVSVGHADDGIVAALKDQLETVHYVHTLDYTTRAAEAVANQMLKPYKGTLAKAYFVNSGSEANEAAMKMAVQYFYETGKPQKTEFISRLQSYHGNCLGGLSLSSHVSRRAPFEGVLSDHVHFVSPANEYRYKAEDQTTAQYVEQLANELENKILEIGQNKIAAFVAETIVGATSGCMTAPAGYFKAIRAVCEKYDVLLILDEIMCGSGRTGTFFAWEQEDVVPDIVTCGKALSGGYGPLSACICTPKIIEGLEMGSKAFNNGHTYQAFPLSCRAGLAVLKKVEEENLLKNVKSKGQYLSSELKKALKDSKIVGNIRGRGLFWGIEFVSDISTKSPFDPLLKVGPTIQSMAWQSGVAVYPGTGTVDGKFGDHILISPMFNVTEEEIDIIVSAVSKSVYEFENSL
ncbi:unnamed protein product [Kuraishia capsulata CBS 1993]|uniref:Acetylornithine aminotransferase, mitochondrial n=1 Tax=Kuraishia capsulata CBS 1993 TaxID=1382522 RepID=W6MKP1_9ASCO|nr:uncharacterized protein KUCA_T00001281001 [Kuraishia capsulata CBS 1993]CDK25312.1 unnamed protein product [Kuraishia capsulata CBS 1993]